MGLILSRRPKEIVEFYNTEGDIFGTVEVLKVEGIQVKLRFHGFNDIKIIRSELKINNKNFNKK